MKHAKRLVALFMSLSLIANHTSTVIALGDEYKRLFIEQSLNAPNITWDTKNEVIVGTAFDSMKGVKAIDDEGNDITDKVKVTGSVDTSKEGEYTLTYSIADSEEEPITRVVRVIPNPEFNVSGADYVRTYKGEEFYYKQDLTVTDSKGNDITSSVTCEGNVDINKLGSYNLKYYVPDKKEPILERTVDVIEKNVFNVYLNNEKLQKSLENYNNWLKDPNKDPNKPVSIEKDLAFSIYLDNKTSKFALENQSSEKLDVSIGDEVFANIKVFDKDNNEKLSIELLGSDTGNSEKLDKLKELTYEYGDYISIVTRDSKNCLDITGTLTGDIDNTKEDCKEYYSDGVDNLDYIKNVRFNIVKEGIKTVYNNAPVITGLTEMEKLLTTRDEQLKGISITDDKDTYIPLDEVVITEEKDGNNIIGLRYTVCDDWGREASGVRYLKNPQTNDGRVQIEQSIQTQQEQSSTFTADNSQVTTVLSDNIIEVHGVEYNDGNNQGDTLRFKIAFDQDAMKMNILEADNRLMDNKITDEYFRLDLYSKEGTLKKSLVLNGNDRADSKKLKEFNETEFAYGDQIKLSHKYSNTKLKIEGKVKSGTQSTTTFATGIPSEVLEVSRFELLETGLNQLVNKPPVITWSDKNFTVLRGKQVDLLKDITVTDDIDGTINRSRVQVSNINTNKLGPHTVTYTVKDSWGATYTTDRTVTVVSTEKLTNTKINIYDATGNTTAFTIGFDGFQQKIFITNINENLQFDPKKPIDRYFRIRVLSKTGVTKKDIELTGRDTAENNKLLSLNNYKYAVGDYIELWASTSKSIRVVGEITTDSEITGENFSDGIDNPDFMNNVRFQLKEEQLEAVYNNAPSKIVFKNDLIFRRTDTFDPISYVTEIKDDHDKLDIKTIRTSYDKLDIFNLGEHKVEYRVSDKWGREYTTSTTITTVARNKLEETNIQLMYVDTSGDTVTKSTIATLYFDDVKKKVVPYLNKQATITGESGQDAFTILVYDSNNRKKGELTIGVNTPINEDSFKDLDKINITSGDYIHVEGYSPDAVCINGNVISPMGANYTNYTNGFKDFDKMKNTVFTIQEDGLTAIYNDAPYITFPEVRIYQGDIFDLLSDITIVDDKDTGLTTSCVTVEGDTSGQTTFLDTSNVGYKTITYQISDSWGRTALIERIIFVRPNLEKSQISIKNRNGQTAIVLNPDSLNKRLNVEFKGNLPLNTGNNTTEVSLALYNENNEHVGTLDILGSDTKHNIEQKLQSLLNVTILRGSKIHIDAQNTTQVSITGIVSTTGGNITTGTVDYASGNYDKKYLENTVFKLIDNGIEVVYNEAPSMIFNATGSTTTPLTIYKGDDYRELLLDLVEVEDELEPKLSSKNTVEIRVFERTTTSTTTTATSMPTTTPVSISTSSSVPIKINTTGSYIAYYVVKDSWNKQSSILVKDFDVVTSIGRNVINLGGFKKNFGNVPNMVSIGFNPETMKMTVTRNTAYDKFNNYASRDKYYQINIYSSDGTIKYSSTAGTSTAPRNAFPNLEQEQFEYGDYINIFAFQANRVSIEGPVRTPLQDDYARVINSGDIFINSRFYITEDGLDDEYIEPINVTTGQTVLVYDSGGNGTALKLIIDNTSGKIIIPQNVENNEFYDYIDDKSDGAQIAFKIAFNKAETGERTEFQFERNHQGPGIQLESFVNSTTQNTFESGDYIEFWLRRDEIKDRLKLKYNIETNGIDEDYSDGLKSLDSIQNVRFYFRNVGTTNAHLEAVYNEAPRFEGVDEVNLYMNPNGSDGSNGRKKTYCDFDPREGVRVIDDKSSPSTAFTVSHLKNHDGRNSTYDKIPDWGVGYYKYIYTTTDSWGRVTTVTRDIYVRPNVYKHRFMLYPKTTSATTLTSQNSSTTTGVVITSDSTAAFEIVAKDRSVVNGAYESNYDKYDVINRENTPINPELGDNPAFKISIYSGTNGDKKGEVTLNGNDTGMSEKLDALKEVTFDDNDHVRVWAADSRYLRVSELTSPGTYNNSQQPPNKESYDDGIQDPDNMNNVAFVLDNNTDKNAVGMTIAYNAPASITTTRETLKYKEQIPTNLRDLVSITDDRSNASQMTVKVEGEIDTNKIGKYPVKYTVTDRWGRTVEKTIEFKVKPNYYENTVQVYSRDGYTHMFDIGFDTEHNKLSVNQITTTQTANTSGNTLNIVVRDSNAKVTNTLQINESDFTSQGTLNKIKEIRYVNNGFISFESSSPTSIRITGNITGATSNNFSDGFSNLEEMKNTRFMLKNEGLKCITYEKPVITFTTDKTVILRGEKTGLYDNIDLGFTQPENYIGIEYTVDGLDEFNLGEQQVTFIANDSWNTSATTVRTVTVKERNELENNIIKLKDNTGKKVLVNFIFDTLENKIHVQKVAGATTSTIDSDDLITFKVYDENGITTDIVNINKYNFEHIDTLFNDVEFLEGYMVGITVYDSNKGLSIEGKVDEESLPNSNNKENYSDGVQNQDYIKNVRFKLREEGLKVIYNHAPILTIDGMLRTFKGIEPDFNEGVNVTDSDIFDNNINVEDNVQVDTQFDPNILGDQDSTYIATDNWGRETITHRTITVDSGLLGNRIEYYPNGCTDKPLFYVTLDTKEHKLKVESDYNSSIINRNGNTEIGADPFEITLYNKDAKIKAQLKITTNETLDSLQTKLTTFSGVDFVYGDYIGVYAQDYKNDIKIKGGINVPLTIGEDYSDGITTPDFMNNVKFEITKEELKAVYNEAPELIIPTDSTLEYYKGDDMHAGEGLIVRDDLDLELNADSVRVLEEDLKKFEVVGTTEVSIRVTDKWGRSTEGKRTINVKNSLSRNVIHFGGYDAHLADKTVKTAFKIYFSTTDNTIKVDNLRPNNLLNDSGGGNRYYQIYISTDGTTETNIILPTRYNAGNSNDQNTSQNIECINSNNQKLNSINNIQFKENGYIRIYAEQTFRVSIDGAVRNGLENYANGVNQGENFINTKFIFTEDGLKAQYTNPVQLTTTQTLIEFDEGSYKPFKLKVDHNTGRVNAETIEGSYDGSYDYIDPKDPNYSEQVNKVAFRVNWYDQSASTTRTVSYTRNQRDMGNIVSLINDNGGFDTGDYISFETPNKILSARIKLIGDIKKETTEDTSLANEDFSDGIQDPANMTRTIFHYNKDGNKGFTVEKRQPAVILGAGDISIPQNSTFSITSGVTAMDCDGTNITSQMTISMNGTRLRSGELLDTGQIGPKEIVYEVTNKWGIKTAVYRTVNIYSESNLTLKDTNAQNIIEQGSYNPEGLKEYLISLVHAEDPDDGDITSKVTVEHNINIEKPGIYNATYAVTNSFGKTTTLSNVRVEVIRTISVDVPIKVPFQVVTNLLDKNDDPFVAGTLNLRNNKTSDVKVSLDGFTQKQGSGSLQIVSPGTVTSWDDLTTEDTMSKMALGIYNKTGDWQDSSYEEKESPLWLYTGMTTGTTIGTLERAPSLTSPSTAKIGFNSKHGKKFRGGTSRGKFELRFKFE